MAVFPCPLLLKDYGFDPFRPSMGWSHRAMAECWLHLGTPAGSCYSWCPETAARCQPARSRKSLRDSVAAAFTGIMENYKTHLAPGFTLNDLDPAPANVAVFWGLLGPGGFNSLYQMSFQQWNCFSLCGLRTSWTPPVPGDLLFPPEHHQASSRRVADFALPLFTVLM